MLLESLTVDPDEFEARTGWQAKPEGLCKGDRCVPLPAEDRSCVGCRDARRAARHAADPRRGSRGVWVLGPEGGGRALTTAVAPDLRLPDHHGETFSLSSLRGRKVA